MLDTAATTVLTIWGFPVTNTMLMTLLVSSTLVIIAFVFSRSVKLYPGKFQNVIEYIIEFMFNTSAEVVGEEERTKKFFPIVATFFLFILIGNWMGLLPFFSGIGFFIHEAGRTTFVPLFRSANTDLNATATLGIISAVVTQYFAIKYMGIGEHLKHYFSLNPIYLFIGFLELLSEFTKVISLSFRLYGNIIAGDLVIATFTGIFGILLPLPFMGLEVVVGFVQATVFAMLSLAFTATLSKKLH